MAKTKTGKKYIICDALPGAQGKTSTLVGVYNRLLSDHRFQLIVPNPSRLKRDRWGIFVEKKTGLKILIQTQGDKDFSYDRTKEYLKKNDSKDIDIIIIASHTYGRTLNNVKKIAKTDNYTEIYFGNFRPKDKYSWQPPYSNIIMDTNIDALYNLICKL